MNKKIIFNLILVSATTYLMSCQNQTIKPISPNEEIGLEGNQEDDEVIIEDDTKLNQLFDYVKDNLYFQYQTEVNVDGSEQSFTQTFTPYAWYVDEQNKDDSFGYAMNPKDYYMFKFYLSDDGQKAYPSIFEYGGYNTLEKVESIYGPFTIAHPYMLEDVLDTLTYVKTNPNKYLLTDTDTMAIFQYMTTVGSSITNYINSVTIDIINEDEHIFDVTIDLGQYGEIISRYTPLQNTKIDFVNDMLINNQFNGVDYYDEVKQFFDIIKNNNFTLHGILSKTVQNETYTIYCSNDYFYLKYADSYADSYSSFGYALISKNTPVEVKTFDSNTNQYITTTYNLNYDSCFEFEEDQDGNLYFNNFVGPIENDGIKYLEVETLPEVGEVGILYIVSENGQENVYEWVQQGDGSYQYSLYSSWYDTVGDFYINYATATFYLSSSGLCDYGFQLFEKTNKDNDEDYQYYSTNSDVLSALANGLFGWGFNESTTWMDYIQYADLKINKDSNNNIASADIGLSVLHSGDEELIYYTIDNFNSTSVSKVETFLNNLGGN